MSARMKAAGPVRSVLVLAGLAALAAAAAAVLASADPAALCALPALALPLMLALRRYPGERMLAVLARARTRPRTPRPRASAPTGARAQFPRPRGGLLLGRALAVRPPPAAATAQG